MPFYSQSGHLEALKTLYSTIKREGNEHVFWYLNSLLQEYLSTNILPLSHLTLEHRLGAEERFRKWLESNKKSSKVIKKRLTILSASLQYQYAGTSALGGKRTMHLLFTH